MIDINEMSNEEIEQIVNDFEGAINAYLEDKEDEILFYYTAMNLHTNATDDEIINTIFDIVCNELSNELTKIFGALVEQQELVDVMVLEYLEELFEVNDLRRKRKWRHGKILRAMKENIKSVIWGE